MKPADSKEQNILVAADAGIFIASFSDISEAIGKCFGADGLILSESDLSADFFNLHTGLAGELFQKATNYELRLAIILTDPEVYGERFSELVYEHRNHNAIRFVRSEDEARAWLAV